MVRIVKVRIASDFLQVLKEAKTREDINSLPVFTQMLAKKNKQGQLDLSLFAVKPMGVEPKRPVKKKKVGDVEVNLFGF